MRTVRVGLFQSSDGTRGRAPFAQASIAIDGWLVGV